PELQAEIGILEIPDDIVRSETADRFESRTRYEQAGAGHRRNIAQRIRRSNPVRQPRVEMPIDPPAERSVLEIHAGMLQCTVRVQQFDPERADLLVLAQLSNRRAEPARLLRYDIRIEHQEQISRGGRGAGV